MPTPVGHTLAALALHFWSRRTTALSPPGRGGSRELNATGVGSPSHTGDDIPATIKEMTALVVSALFPDLDFGLSFLAGRNLHHHFTHSLAFATLYYVGCRIFFSRVPATWMGAAYLSHVALDLFSKDTSAPFGVPLFWPLSERYFIAPVLLWSDVRRGTLAELLGLHNWMAVGREVLLLGPVALFAWWLSRSRSRSPYRSSDRDTRRPPSS